MDAPDGTCRSHTSESSRDASALLGGTKEAVGSVRKRNPTAVQSGNRHATPLGERRRENRRRQTVCVKRVARQRFTLSGPRRAQARERLAKRIGPIPETGRQTPSGVGMTPPAQAVTSRVTSWAFWFAPLGKLQEPRTQFQTRTEAAEKRRKLQTGETTVWRLLPLVLCRLFGSWLLGSWNFPSPPIPSRRHSPI